MEEDFNNLEIEKEEENSSRESSNKRKKCISTKRRKELINIDSDNDEKISNKNIPLKKFQNEESKEQENLEYINENINSKYINNKFNKKEQNSIGGALAKDNSTLQEKLKKIFMNRDKVKFQYTKQDIPDNLKYHSDDSESSDISGLKKSKISKKKMKITQILIYIQIVKVKKVQINIKTVVIVILVIIIVILIIVI